MILKDLAPDEARVHFLLGKLYKSLNNKNLAVRHFTIALSLDPKVMPCCPPSSFVYFLLYSKCFRTDWLQASQQIKEAIESLEDGGHIRRLDDAMNAHTRGRRGGERPIILGALVRINMRNSGPDTV